MLGNVQERWRSRAAIQIFVAAPDCQLDAVAIEMQRHRACAVAKIPNGKRPSLSGSLGHGSDIVPLCRPVMDVSQVQEIGVRPDAALELLPLHKLEAKPGEPGSARRDIAVSVKIADFGEDGRPVGEP